MSKEIANWKQALTEAAEKTAKTERPAESTISLKGGIMNYQGEALAGNTLECVIIASSFARTCYDRPYDPDDLAPPDCFANAIDQVDLVAHENVPNPRADICTEKACESAVFGSALVGRGPLCKTRRKLIVMPTSALTGNLADAELATISTPPTSAKNWSTYASKVASGSGLPPWAVKTRIISKPHPKKQFEITFEAIEPIEDETLLAAIHGRVAEAENMLLTPFTYDQEEAPSKPAKTGKKKY